jgi:hypothetical protein
MRPKEVPSYSLAGFTASSEIFCTKSRRGNEPHGIVVIAKNDFNEI